MLSKDGHQILGMLASAITHGQEDSEALGARFEWPHSDAWVVRFGCSARQLADK